MLLCRRVLGILYLAVATAAPDSALAQSPSGSATLLLDGNERSIPTASTATGGASAAAPLFALEPLAEAVGILDRGAPGTEARALRLADGSQVVLEPGSATITVGAEILTLSEPARVEGPYLFVPFDFLQRVLGEVGGLAVRWDGVKQQLVLERGGAAPRSIRVEQVSLQDTTTVVLEAAEPMPYRIVRSASTVEVVFPAQRVVFERSPVLDDPRVVRVEALADRLRLLLAPGVGADDYSLKDPFRIVLDVHAVVAATEPTAPAVPAPRRPGVRTIVLDPGHGGTETGAIGSRATQEKDLTLALAQLVKSKLESRVAARVVLTRSEDQTLALSDRSSIANQYKADLFVSIHLNSSRGSTAFGAETYFLSVQASDERAAAAAAAENASPSRAPNAGPADEAAAELELLLWDLAQTRHLARSQRLASLIQEELNTALGLRDRGVKQAPFRVLMGAAMPAVLVEFGFLSNPDEEARLADATYRGQLADALVAAIARFKAELEGHASALAPPPEPMPAPQPLPEDLR